MRNLIPKTLLTILTILTVVILPSIVSAARTDVLWDYSGGNYYKPNGSASGVDLLIFGSNHYLNWNAVTGVNGYGLRDNSGVIEFKNSGGAWAGIGSGGGGGAATSSFAGTYPVQLTSNAASIIYSLAFGTTTVNNWLGLNTFLGGLTSTGVTTLATTTTQVINGAVVVGPGGYPMTDVGITAAIAALGNATGTILISDGTVTMNNPVSFAGVSGITIQCQSKNGVFKIPQGSLANFGFTYMFSGGNGITISGCTFDGQYSKYAAPPANQGGGLAPGSHWTITNNVIKDFNYFGVWLGTTGRDVKVTYNDFIGPGRGNDHIGGGGSFGVEIAYNTWESNIAGNAWDNTGGQNFDVHDNTVYANSFYIEAMQNIKVHDNIFIGSGSIVAQSDNGYSPAVTSNSNNIQFNHNTLWGGGAIVVSNYASTSALKFNGGNISITNNIIASSTTYGILVHGGGVATSSWGANYTISGNTISDINTSGVATVNTGNGIANTAGINIMQAYNVTVTGNTIVDDRATPKMQYGIQIGQTFSPSTTDEPDRVTVADNRILGGLLGSVNRASPVNTPDYIEFSKENLLFPGSLLATASSTIGNGTQTGGLTISGGATTTGRFLVSGSSDDTIPASGALGGKLGLFKGSAYGMIFGEQSNGIGFIQEQRIDGTANTYGLLLNPNGGNISIGTTNQAGTLTINDTNPGIQLQSGGTTIGGINVTGATGEIRIGSELSSYFTTLYSGNSEAARITTNGNFGIGTTSPYAALSVVGASGVVADHFTATSTTSASSFSGNVAVGTGSTLWNLGASPQFSNAFVATSSGMTYPALLITWAGNVGIGSTSPDALVSIMDTSGYAALAIHPVFEIGSTTAGVATTTNFLLKSDGSLTMNISNPIGNTNALTITGTAQNAIWNINNTTGAQLYGKAQDNQLRFVYCSTASCNSDKNLLFDSDNSGTTRLFLSGTGNMGLGSTTPNSRLLVAGASSQDGIELTGTGVTSDYIDADGAGSLYFDTNRRTRDGQFTNTGQTNSRIIMTSAAGAGNIAFSTTNTNNSLAGEIMRIQGNGSVAIGTTTAVANFQVTNSSANATTTLEFGKANQTKGSCIKLYRTDGSAIYAYVIAGNTTFTLSTTANVCSSVTGF